MKILTGDGDEMKISLGPNNEKMQQYPANLAKVTLNDPGFFILLLFTNSRAFYS